MKIRQIKAFLAVVHTGSVRAAAARLSLTQSTVAKAISGLEADLGAELFDRGSNGLRLNRAGLELLPYAETIATNSDRATAAVEAIVAGTRPTLRLAVTPVLQPEVLAEAVGRFRSRFPDVKIVFSSGFLSDCLPLILTDRVDLSLLLVGRYRHQELGRLVEERLFEVDQGVVAHPSHPIFEPGADLRRLFAESEWLSTAQDEDFLTSELVKFGAGVPKSLTICDFYGIDALKGRRRALSLSPLSTADDPRYEGRLRALPKEAFPLAPLSVSFFRRKGMELSPHAEYMGCEADLDPRNGSSKCCCSGIY